MYFTFPWLLYFIIGGLHLITPFADFICSLHPLSFSNHQFVPCIYEPPCFVYLRLKDNSVWLRALYPSPAGRRPHPRGPGCSHSSGAHSRELRRDSALPRPCDNDTLADVCFVFRIILAFSWRIMHVGSRTALLAHPVASQKSSSLPSVILSLFSLSWQCLCGCKFSRTLSASHAVLRGPSHQTGGSFTDLSWVRASLFPVSAATGDPICEPQSNLISKWLSSHTLIALYTQTFSFLQYE